MSSDSTFDDGEHSLCNGLRGLYSLGLHVSSIFIVLGASLLGCALPIISTYVPFLRRNPFLFIIAKTAATGVLLSVASIHLINDSIENFNEDCVSEGFRNIYPAWAFFFALCAALIMHMVDTELAEIAERWMRRKQAKQITQQQQQSLTELASKDQPGVSLTNEAVKGEEEDPTGSSLNVPDNLCCELTMLGVNAASPMQDCCQETAQKQKGAADLPGCGHNHEIAVPDDMSQLRRVIAAICMEFGVTLHSVFVGLDIGLTTDAALKPLLVALVFHQLFEGMSLGSRLVDAKFKLGLEVVLAVVFSVSAPMGMAAATIAVSISRDAMKGGGFVLMMAVLSSFCGGILLYLAFSLLFSDFSSEMKLYCADGQPRRMLRKVTMYAALWVGMLLMALVGKWI